jgi:hypothetical protein
MEHEPRFRAVGNASEKVKQKELNEMRLKLEDHINSLSPEAQKEIRKAEYPKTETELSLIALINAESNRVMQEAGTESYDIPTENYHIIPPDIYKREVANDNGGATALYMQQAAIFSAPLFRGTPIHFMTAAFHETLHLKSHLALEVEEDVASEEGSRVTMYRAGVTAYSAQKRDRANESHTHFRGLHEAIVSEQEKRSFPNLLNAQFLKREREWLMSDDARASIKHVSEKEGIPIDDFTWIEKAKGNEYEYAYIGYPAQRKVLRYICEEIAGQFPDRYQSPDAVFKEFLKAQFTGRLSSIAKLIKGTFGETGFRILGNMGRDGGSSILTFETMRKLRIKGKE